MIFLIYGKNDLKAREKLKSIQKEEEPKEIIEINLDEISLSEFGDAILTPNMFGYKNLILANSEKLRQKELLKYIEISQKAPKENLIVFLTNQDLKSNSKLIKFVKSLENTKIIRVEEEKDYTIFNFLDAVFNKNRKKSYTLLEEIIQKEESPQKTHSMLIYQLRNVAKTKFGSEIKAPAFVKRKLRTQANKFTKKEILDLYQHFYKTDRDMKMGLIPENILNIINIEEVMESKN